MTRGRRRGGACPRPRGTATGALGLLPFVLAGFLLAPPAAAEAPPAPSPAVDVPALPAKVQARYAKAAGVHARFRQETTLMTVGQDMAASGDCWFAKPGKMRWVYEQPDPQTLVSDGATFWLHQPLRNQVMVSPVPPE